MDFPFSGNSCKVGKNLTGDGMINKAMFRQVQAFRRRLPALQAIVGCPLRPFFMASENSPPTISHYFSGAVIIPLLPSFRGFPGASARGSGSSIFKGFRSRGPGSSRIFFGFFIRFGCLHYWQSAPLNRLLRRLRMSTIRTGSSNIKPLGVTNVLNEHSHLTSRLPFSIIKRVVLIVARRSTTDVIRV